MSLVESEKTLAKDPVCGMSVDPATAKHRLEYGGKTYYFCCDGCRTKFAADPARYLAAKPAPPVHHGHAAGSAGAAGDQSVKDPVCGMSVDPATAKHRFEHEGATRPTSSAAMAAGRNSQRTRLATLPPCLPRPSIMAMPRALRARPATSL